MRGTSHPAHLWAWGLLLAGALGALWVAADRLGHAKPRKPAPPPVMVMEEAPPPPQIPIPTPAKAKPLPRIEVPAEDPRVAAEHDYDVALTDIAREADRLEGVFTTFLARGWQGHAKGGYVRNWYAMWDGGMEGNPYPAQAATHRDLLTRIEVLRQRFQAAEEGARRADLLPGTRRALRAKYRLDDRLWER